MSAAMCHLPTMKEDGEFVMSNQRLTREELAEVVRKIHALRRVTKTTGFFTNRGVVELLAPLCQDDLIEVGEALKLKPREMPRNTQGKPEANFNR